MASDVSVPLKCSTFSISAAAAPSWKRGSCLPGHSIRREACRTVSVSDVLGNVDIRRFTKSTLSYLPKLFHVNSISDNDIDLYVKYFLDTNTK